MLLQLVPEPLIHGTGRDARGSATGQQMRGKDRSKHATVAGGHDPMARGHLQVNTPEPEPSLQQTVLN